MMQLLVQVKCSLIAKRYSLLQPLVQLGGVISPNATVGPG